ncbi:MAG: B12-binding domain-containing radical SAM protein [Magnetococcales bacterium]|nr:B12-binding domain-containing radical SAM protein [Magnetococcales bacterium]
MITMPNTGWFGKRKWLVPPYTLALLGAIVRQSGHAITLLDPNLDNLSLDQVLDFIVREEPDVVGITAMSLEYARGVHELTQAIRARGLRCKLLVGGIFATTTPQLAMGNRAADFAILGEGEARIPRILEMLAAEEDKSAFATFDGIAFWDHDDLRINPPQAQVADLDTIPLPAYDLVGLHRYSPTNHRFGNVYNARYLPYAVTTTTRGCPFHCIYCSSHAIDGRKVRQRSAENVLAEIDWLVREYGIRELVFLDDQLNYDRTRYRHILNGLIERDYDLHWKAANITAFLLDVESLDLMARSKCYQVIFPIESGNQYVLDHILRKPLKLSRIPALVNRCRELGMETAVDFVIGSPGETWEQIRDSCNFADLLDADLTSFHIATPLPHTELYDKALSGGHLPSGFAFDNQEYFGFGRGCITTDEFAPHDLHILRALEWDRINFKTAEKRERFANMTGISQEELKAWRRNTIRNLGLYFPHQEDPAAEALPDRRGVSTTAARGDDK